MAIETVRATLADGREVEFEYDPALLTAPHGAGISPGRVEFNLGDGNCGDFAALLLSDDERTYILPTA